VIKASELNKIIGNPSVIPEETPLTLQRRTDKNVDFFIAPSVVREKLEAHGHLAQRDVIAFINLKGGTGKTTSSVTCARRSCDFGLKTCLLDIDAQASATFMLAQDQSETARPFIEFWDKPEEVSSALINIDAQLSLLPSSLDNSLLDLQLSRPISQKNAVKECCDELFKMGHDLIFVDCPPSLGAGVISTICASSKLIIPTTADSFALRGIDLTISETEAISEAFGMKPPKIFILLTHFDRRIKMSESVLADLKQRYGDRVIAQPIRTSSYFAQAQERNRTVFDFPKAKKAQLDYDFAVRAMLHLNPNNISDKTS
jgi:chromosome partitioning protein